MRSDQLSYPPDGPIIPQLDGLSIRTLMKILRFQTPDLSPRFGWVHEDLVGEIDGDPFGA